MVKFELPKLASRVRFPSPAPTQKRCKNAPLLCFILGGIEPETQAIQSERERIWVYTSVSHTQKTAVKERSPHRGAEGVLDSGIFPSPAPTQKRCKNAPLLCFILGGIEPETQAIQSERERIWVYTSVSHTQKTAVKERSPNRGAEGVLDSGIFPSPAPYKNRRFIRLFFYLY